MTPELIRKTINSYFDAIHAMDEDAWISLFDESAQTCDPVGAPPLQGHDALRLFFKSMAGLFVEIRFTQDYVFVSGNGAAVKFGGQGKLKNGQQVNFEGIDVFELNGSGKIQKLSAYWNPDELMKQVTGNEILK